MAGEPYLHVLVPTRGRPQAVPEMVNAFWASCNAATPDEIMYTTALLFVVDGDDPHLRAYETIVAAMQYRRLAAWEFPFDTPAHPEVNLYVSAKYGNGMVAALNAAAQHLVYQSDAVPYAIGFMGDDHRPRTIGWDRSYLDALIGMGTGIVYGNDLLQRQNIPTQVAMTSDIIRQLGFMCPTVLKHMYADNFWLELGHGAGCIQYLPDTIVEHMHPVAGKADWDENYIRVDGFTNQDKIAWEEYRAHHLSVDIAAVCSLRQKEQ